MGGNRSSHGLLDKGTLYVNDPKMLPVLLTQLSPNTFAACGKCSAILVDAKDLITAIEKMFINFGDETPESASDVLYSIIEPIPEFFRDEDWQKWIQDNEYRRLDIEYGDGPGYLCFKEVFLYHNNKCKCFKSLKPKQLSSQYLKTIKEIKRSRGQ